MTIYYEFDDGSRASATYTRSMASGSGYSVTSPSIDGFTPDQEVVSGTLTGDVTVTVVYTAESEIEIPEENPPLVEEPTIDIPDEEPPLTEEPTIDIPDEEPPLVEIPEEKVPLDDTPKTGDASRAGFWAALCGISLLGIVLLGKKREGEEA